MKISAKTRYGLSAMICMSQNFNSSEYITVISLAEKLEISKIYLEQVFSLLKRAKLVISTKGAQGGYQLSRLPSEITVLDIFSAIETSLFEKTEPTVLESQKFIEDVMIKNVFQKLDASIKDTLSGITLKDLVVEVDKHISDEGYMFYL